MLCPYLELVRVQLTPTAVADSFAGYCLACMIQSQDPSRSTLAAVAGSSVLLYWSGMAQNDLFDLARDRAARPARVLARGSVTPRAALAVAAALAAGGCALSLWVSWNVFAGALAIVLFSLLYNAGGKRVPLVGNLLMGSCRAANLLLGALAVVPLASLPEHVDLMAAAALLGLYIAGVTAVSLLEDQPHQPGSFLLITLPLLLVPACLARAAGFELRALLNSLALAALLLAAVLRGLSAGYAGGAGRSAAPDAPAPAPHPAEQFVRVGLSGIFLVDAGFLLARGRLSPALVEYGLMILAWLWRRRWLQSPP